MSKTIDEISAEILVAAISSGQIKTRGNNAITEAADIASAFTRIREAVASEVPPHP